MGKFEKLIFKLLSGTSDKKFTFDELRNVLLHLDFEERTTAGSYHIFKKKGIIGIINLQRDKNSQAKPYQVKQVRDFIVSNKIMTE